MAPRLGVQMFTLREYTQDAARLDTAFARVREIGYTTIQVSGFGQIPPEQTAELAARHDLEIAATHVPWERFLDDLDAVIDEHRQWACRHTAVGFIPPDVYLSIAGLDRFLDEATGVVDRLMAADMTFSYHHHNHEFVRLGGETWLERLRCASQAVGVCMELDTHWIVAGGGDPVRWIHACGARMPLLHLKDFAISENFRRKFAPVGDGNLNWEAILEAVAAHPIEYCFVEQDDCYGEDPFACLARSYRYLNERGWS